MMLARSATGKADTPSPCTCSGNTSARGIMRGTMATGLDIFAAARGAPVLPDAACKGRAELFDPHPATDPHRLHTSARRCACATHARHWRSADWLDTLPPDEWPAGVVAGRVVDGRRTYRNPARQARNAV